MGDVTNLNSVKARQRAWATRLGIEFDVDGYCTTLDRNLFHPLSESCRAELAGGDGSELGKGSARGNIQALHSAAGAIMSRRR